MSILFLVVIGAAAGFIATRMMGVEAGLPQTIAIGVLGALIGGLILRLLVSAFATLSGFVGAVLGALLLIWLWQKITTRGR